MSVGDIAERVERGGRISRDEALDAVHRRADGACSAGWPTTSAAAKHPGGVVTYIIDRNVNYTNVCVARCKFCAFYRPVGSTEGYTLGFDEIFRKIDETIRPRRRAAAAAGRPQSGRPARSGTRICSARVKQRYPDVQAARAVAAGGHPHLAAVAAAGAGRDRSADRGRARQHSRRRRRDSGRPRPPDPELLQQGDRRRVARRDARTRIAPACARRRR